MNVKEMCVLKHLSVTAVLLALTVSGFVFARDTGFKGKWILDKGASNATEEIPDNLVQEIKPDGSDVTIITTWREPKTGIAPIALLGIMTTKLQLRADGQEQTNYIGPFKQVSKTTQNGNQMVTEWTAVDQNGKTVSGHWTRTLSPDGQQMTLDVQEQDSGQQHTAKLVFKRK
jgi:hypothetical protein